MTFSPTCFDDDMNKFYIIKNGHVSLFCRKEHQEGNVIDAYVINGAWEFVLDLGSMTMTWHPPRSEVCVMTDFHILRHKSYWQSADYNMAIEFVSSYIKMNIIHRLVIDSRLYISYMIPFKWKLFKKSIQAFKQTWSKNSPHTPISWDDDIPF